jgi:WD40 repeat protein
MYSNAPKYSIHLGGSPSFLPNNLSASPSELLAYSRLNDVFVVRGIGESMRVPVMKSRVTQVKFIPIQGVTVLAVLSDQGLQLWSADGDNMIYLYPISSLMSTEQTDSSFVNGIASDGHHFSVGASSGKILVFDCSSGLSGGTFPISQRLESESSSIPISAISCSPNLIAAGNDFGSIFAYRPLDGYSCSGRFKGTGSPCTALAQSDRLIMAGFSSGHVRIYRADINELTVEISAHARAITAMDYQDSTELLATCSVDQQIFVWSMPSFTSKAHNTVNCVFSTSLENQMCTGIAFLGEEKLAVSAYDEEDVAVFCRS